MVWFAYRTADWGYILKVTSIHVFHETDTKTQFKLVRSLLCARSLGPLRRLHGDHAAAILLSFVAIATAHRILFASGLHGDGAGLVIPGTRQAAAAGGCPRASRTMAARRSLEDLDLTAEEAAGLKAAFRDENFRRLFAEYAAELADPGQRAIYEAEVAALERQRGVDARFLHPTPGWVLRTSQAGARRCYLNVCSNALVGRPEARPEPGGSRWTLPHCLAPGREELSGRPGRPLRLVYDVVFHPDTLRLAARSARFRRMVDDTALDAVEKRFSPGLDRANAAPLRGAVKYKGVPQATLLRKPLPGGAPPPEPEDQGETALPPCPPSPYAYPPPEPETEAGPPQPTVAPPPATATTPRWTIRHRSYVDLQDYRHSRDSAPSPVPRELVVTVELPLLSSAAQAELEVREQELCLDSRRPTAAYALRLPLPYPVDESRGRATFNKALRQLVVTLPVVPKPAPSWPALHRQGDSQPEEETAPSSSPNELVSVSLQEPLQGGILPAIKGEQPSQEPSDTPPAPGASYVRESLVELPVCADKIGPASPVSPVIPSSSMEAPNLHSGTTSLHRPELPVCAEAVDPIFPGTPKVLVIAPDCNGDTDSRGSEVRACPSVSRSTKADFSEEREEDTGSLSLRPNLTSPALPPTHVCKMDLQKCPGSITSAVPPAGPSDSATASAHDLCEDTCLDCVACGNCSNLAQNPECPPSTEVAVYPSSRGQTDRSQPVACPSATSHAGLSPRSGTPDLPVLAKTALDTDANIPSLVSTGPGSPVSPICPAPAQCPPFHCTQDEEALTLLFQVPGVDLQSLKGEFSPDHYQVSFSDRDSLSYVFLLQLSSENKLVPPETRIDVSFSNAVIGLAKSPETAGLWTKLYFGLNKEALQVTTFKMTPLQCMAESY